MPALARPLIVFSAIAMAAGVVVMFVPLALPSTSGNLAAVATLARWRAGRYGDLHDRARLLMPGVLSAAVGMLALVLHTSSTAVIVGMALFGAGFGVVQNASLALMFEQVSSSGCGTVSALWNLACDAGPGVGAAGFGVVAAQTGFSTAFALTAALEPRCELWDTWWDL